MGRDLGQGRLEEYLAQKGADSEFAVFEGV